MKMEKNIITKKEIIEELKEKRYYEKIKKFTIEENINNKLTDTEIGYCISRYHDIEDQKECALRHLCRRNAYFLQKKAEMEALV